MPTTAFERVNQYLDTPPKMHHEIIGFSATAPGAGGAAAAPYTGDSLTVRNAVLGSVCRLLNITANKQAAGFTQVTAPSWNDTTRGLRMIDQITNPLPLLGSVPSQVMQPQELMAVTIGGSAVAGDFEQGLLHVWYENVPGLNGRYMDAAEVKDKGLRMVTVQASITAGAGGGWTGAAALNATTDLLRANTDYALIGASIQARCNGLGIRAPDWSNVRVGIPGNQTRPDITAEWFLYLSRMLGFGAVPIFNSANKAAIQIDVGQDENAAAVPFSLNLVEILTPGINDR